MADFRFPGVLTLPFGAKVVLVAIYSLVRFGGFIVGRGGGELQKKGSIHPRRRLKKEEEAVVAYPFDIRARGAYKKLTWQIVYDHIAPLTPSQA